MQMDKIIVIKGLGADYVSPSLPVHIDPYEEPRRFAHQKEKFFSVLQKTNRLLLFIRLYNENWYVAHQLIYQMKIGVGSAYSRK